MLMIKHDGASQKKKASAICCGKRKAEDDRRGCLIRKANSALIFISSIDRGMLSTTRPVQAVLLSLTETRFYRQFIYSIGGSPVLTLIRSAIKKANSKAWAPFSRGSQ